MLRPITIVASRVRFAIRIPRSLSNISPTRQLTWDTAAVALTHSFALAAQKNAACFNPNRVHVALFADNLAYVQVQESVVGPRNRKDATHASFKYCLCAHSRRKRFRYRNYFDLSPDLHAAARPRYLAVPIDLTDAINVLQRSRSPG